MYNLLIVDDEPIIADMLFDLFSDVKEPEFDVYKAYSGYEALDWMKRARIDIMLSDICMPGISGLEVQKEICRRWPECKVIFLTGFNEFDYVQTAMRNAGTDYVLKTEGEEAILRAVERAVGEIEQKRRNEELVEKAKQSLHLAIPLLRDKYLLDLAEGKEEGMEERENRFLELEIPLRCGMPVLLLIGLVDFWPEGISLTEKMKVAYGMQNIAQEHLSSAAVAVPVLFERTKILWLIQPSLPNSGMEPVPAGEEQWEEFLLFVHGTMDAIQAGCRELLHISASFAAAGEAVDWEKLGSAFDALKIRLEKAGRMSREVLVIDASLSALPDGTQETRETEEEHAVRLQLKKMAALRELLENGQKDEFTRMYKGMMEVAERNRNSCHELCLEFYYSLSAAFLSHINRWKLTERLSERLDLGKLTRMDTRHTFENMEEYFGRLAECIFEEKKEESFQNANRIFGFIKTHTEKNLGGDLSLTRFADLLHFHPFYLSRLFKQVTGKSLSDYIAGVKLNKARELLGDDNLKVSEIAASLGFDTPSYFTRFFKKRTGLTPQDYRNALAESGQMKEGQGS